MKTAVLHQLGTNPRYEDFKAPIPQNDQQVLVNVKASAIKQLDKLKVSGKHYTSYDQLPAVIGTDGVGTLENGTRIYALGITGMLAEKAIVDQYKLVKLPGSLNFEKTAALPNALIGSDAALLYRAKIQKGEVVLVNGATGVSGKVAVQMAKNRGASTVIATGRNAEALEALKDWGADIVIPLREPEKVIMDRLQKIQRTTPIDIVLDYLWGQSMEIILKGFAASKPHRMRIVLIGEMAGASLPLPSGILRSTKMELIGSGFGSISMEELTNYMQHEMLHALQLAVEGKLQIDTVAYELKDIESIWQKEEESGKRVVVNI